MLAARARAERLTKGSCCNDESSIGIDIVREERADVLQ